MNLYMTHGRLDPDTSGTDIEGNEVEDWGFDGPTLAGSIGFHCTYGFDGQFNIWFKDEEACSNARAATGWDRFDDCALTVEVQGDCLRIYSLERDRFEYFGEWGLK